MKTTNQRHSDIRLQIYIKTNYKQQIPILNPLLTTTMLVRALTFSVIAALIYIGYDIYKFVIEEINGSGVVYHREYRQRSRSGSTSRERVHVRKEIPQQQQNEEINEPIDSEGEWTDVGREGLDSIEEEEDGDHKIKSE